MHAGLWSYTRPGSSSLLSYHSLSCPALSHQRIAGSQQRACRGRRRLSQCFGLPVVAILLCNGVAAILGPKQPTKPQCCEVCHSVQARVARRRCNCRVARAQVVCLLAAGLWTTQLCCLSMCEEKHAWCSRGPVGISQGVRLLGRLRHWLT